MIKKKMGIIVSLLISFVCFMLGLVACVTPSDETNNKGEGAHIVVRTEEMEFPVEVGSEYTTPIAGVFDVNLDRIDGKTIITRVYNASNKLLEESTEQIYFRFITTGTWKIVYSAYVDDKKDASISDTEITVYVCSILNAPQNFIVESKNTLKWAPVENAIGYEVSVNGEETVTVTTEAFTSDIFEGSGYYVAVKALGDKKQTLDSDIGTYRNRTPLKEGELMAFNDPNYALDVTAAVAENLTLPPDEIEWLSEEECAGSTGGALKFRIKSGNGGWGVFKLLLMEGVKLNTNDDWTGMEVRFKIDSEHYQPEKTYFVLSNAAGPNNNKNICTYLSQETNDQWLVMKLEKNQIIGERYTKYTTVVSSTANFADNVVTWGKNENAYGYQIVVTKTAPDGTQTSKTYKNYSNDNGFVVDDTQVFSFDITTDTNFYTADEGYSYTASVNCEIPTSGFDYLNFNLWDLVRTTGKADVYMDYIRLYKDELEAPQALSYENGKLTWTPVDGAARYTLNVIKTIDGKEISTHYDVQDSEFTLSSIGLDPATTKFAAEVRAIPEDATYASSAWTAFVALETPTGLVINEDGLLTWTAVEKAVGYVVSVNGEEISTSTNSLELAPYLTQDVIVRVKALAGVGNLDGEYSNVCAKAVLTGNQLATFNSVAYEGLITTLPKGEQGATGANSVYSVTHVEETNCEGSNGGAVDVVIEPNSGRQADFQVTFAKTVDLTGYDGISIRFKVYDTSYYAGTDDTSKLYLKLVNASGSTYTGCKIAKTVREVTATGEWLTVTFDDVAYINACLLDEGTQLTFQFYMDGIYTNNRNGFVGVYLDDISYYTKSAE